MKVGISCYPTFGGSGVIATEIGLALGAQGHQVHFICYDIPRRLPPQVNNVFFHGVEIREYPLFQHQPYALSLASKMVEVATYEGLDILHVHYAVPHATSAYLAKQILGEKAPKVVTTLHGTDITLVGQDRSYLPITRFSISESDAVTAPSTFLKGATYDMLNISTSVPIEVIPNFIDTDFFAPAPTDSTKNPLSSIIGACPKAEGIRVLIHVSNFRAVKRIPDLIQAFAAILKMTKAHLVLIGDGPERSAAEELARTLNVHEHICFLGKQDALVPWLQIADVFLLPSELESFGLAALEAMSCGVPVVATNTQGIPEVVIDGETGLLSEVGDWNALARNALKLLEDEELRSKYGKASRQRALKYFGRDLAVQQYIELYETLL